MLNRWFGPARIVLLAMLSLMPELPPAEREIAMIVRELVQALQALPDQDATVVIGEGSKPDEWLIVTGLTPRRIFRLDDDRAKPGSDMAIEIV